MRSVKRVIVFGLILLMTAMTVVFILENNQPVSLVFLGWSTPHLPLAAYIVLAMLIGWSAGLILALAVRAKVKRGGLDLK